MKDNAHVNSASDTWSVNSPLEGARWNKSPQQSSQPRWVTTKKNRKTLCPYTYSEPVADCFNFKGPSVIRNNHQEEGEELERS